MPNGIKKTHDEFIKELEQRNPNIKVIGTYINAITKIKCECKIDSYIWEAVPNNLLKGKGCPKCGIKSRSEKRRLSQDEFENIVHQKSPNIQVLSHYINQNCKIKCKCQICGYKWETIASSLKSGTNCPKCNNYIRRTHEEFIDEMKTQNPNIEIIGSFINVQTKIQCRCMIDNHIWYATPSKLLSGQGCPVCGRKASDMSRTLSHQEFVTKLQIKNPNIIVLSDYEKSNKPISVECSIDHHKWNATPNALLTGDSRCKQCANRKLSMSQNDFINRMLIISPNIEIIGEYYNSKTLIDYKCSDCGLMHKATPSNLLRGYGCPVCRKSKGEKECVQYFINNEIKYKAQYTYSDLLGIGNHPLKFDFAILSDDDYVLGLVEYDGIFHYQKQYDDDGFEKLQVHDRRKNIYCQEHNIPLLRIPYWEYNNIEKILNKFINNIS